ncbi:uncharacterized protein LOC141889566 [Acropora palmata]|uniref:uncharacterized protein LOC141889566 n=1 Tax=Acropora palmata TaxID=6131 RepID=UPI003DA0CF1A
MEKTVVIASTSALSASLLTILAYRYLSKTSKDKENKYESEKLLGEYLALHYGKPDEQLPFGYGPKEALDFPLRCAMECIRHTEDSVPSIALDIGCSVGRSTFELAKRFNQVVGIDFSHVFIDAANKLKMYGKLDYHVQREGSLVSPDTAEVDSDIDRSRVSFFHGDACNLPEDLGEFGCVLAANLVCRLPNPYQFLDRLPSLVAPGGTLIITSPYSWSEQFTPKNLWLGGYQDSEGKNVSGFDTLKKYLKTNFELVEDKHLPFFMRETFYEGQWIVVHAITWKRRKSSS